MSLNLIGDIFLIEHLNLASYFLKVGYVED